MTKLLANVTLTAAKLTLFASLVVSGQALSDTTNRALQINCLRSKRVRHNNLT
jgi:hypothetical protein